MNFARGLFLALLFVIASASYAQSDDLKQTYSKIIVTPADDAKSLLGEAGQQGLLAKIMDLTIKEISIPEMTITDYETHMLTLCDYIKDLLFTRLMKLSKDKKISDGYSEQLAAAKAKYVILDEMVSKWDRVVKMRKVRTDFLEDILSADALGQKDEVYVLFGTLYNMASKIMKDYQKDPTPLNAIKVLAVEKIRRRFEELANAKGVPTILYEQMQESDYFDGSSETYKKWELVVESIKEKDLEPRNEDEKTKIDDYKAKIELVGKMEIKE
jgi:hypothetical protein